MKFEELVERYGNRPFFELRELLAVTDDNPKSLKNQLSKWVKNGKLTRLRRGKYVLNDPYQKQQPSVYFISNSLLRPSYVSLETALQYHGLIPEAVAQIRAMTPKHGREWTTKLGTFKYVSLKQERFWGYEQYTGPNERGEQNSFYMARPEKALLDLFYVETGEWPVERIREMRFQNVGDIDPDLLDEFAKRYDSPKVQRARNHFQTCHGESSS